MTITSDQFRRTVEALEWAIRERDEALSRVAALESERDALRIDIAARNAVDAHVERQERRLEAFGIRAKADDDGRLERALADFEVVLRAGHGEGNPYHKGSGEGGGQFTSGPGGGGAGHVGTKKGRKPRDGTRDGREKAKEAREDARQKAREEREDAREKAREDRADAREKSGKRRKKVRKPQRTTTSGKRGVDTRVKLTKSDKPRIKDEARAERAKAIEKRSTGDIQQYAERQEALLIDKLGGTQGTDNGAIDVVRRIGGKEHGIEVKTLVNKGGPNKSGDKAQIKCEADQKARKDGWKAQKPDRELHTVVFDHRDRATDAEGNFIGNKEAWSGKEILYRRGVGAFTVGGMHPVKSWAELKTLMAADVADLPPKARPPEPKAKKE